MTENNEIHYAVGTFIKENSETLNTETKNELHTHDPHLYNAFSLQNDDVLGRKGYEFFTAVGNGFQGNCGTEELQTWVKQMTEKLTSAGYTLDQVIHLIPYYRQTIRTAIKDVLKSKDASIETIFEILGFMNEAIDEAFMTISKTFVSSQMQTLDYTRQVLQELSVPLVPVKTDVAVLPIIGDMDHERSHYIQQHTLDRAANMDLNYIIIDLSGMHRINTEFAKHLLNLLQALKLLGIQVSVSGVRPELSQTIVHLGIPMEGIQTYLTLEQALAHDPVR
ncbi:rsbT co-antagonist protein RsbR [Salsuginibacillus halophilus]|uniref:RsbT co-antagonist protein RsbR n=1 Tax=Salsuginibacillus halophilus TaxID=517424 RepID=A0A2P8H8D3_9BACI|nr:STAS domain-containing protein [Salsuginibacillus halophilus]PSL42439.1 rsbT co-antagonist protein RsbR [Salsuginibacillus halophilus]